MTQKPSALPLAFCFLHAAAFVLWFWLLLIDQSGRVMGI
jgi:hypothetical protein